MAETNFDLVVIGAGPGGYHAAIRGAQLGLSVAVVEKDDGTGPAGIGGVCLNWGCIPSKSLLKNAEVVNHLNHAEDWGIEIGKWSASMSKAVDRSRAVSKTLTNGISFLFKKNKITLVKGKATLKSSTQVEVEGGETLTAKNIVIATGARARSLPGLEIDGVNIITSRHALELREPPGAVAIIGASAIGCEFAYYFNSYGVKVMMFEMLPHLVPREDEEVSFELERQFGKQGIEFATSASVSGVEKKDGRVAVQYEVGGTKHEFVCDKVLLGVGVQPNTDDIGLENVGIRTVGPGFIAVDGNMRTNVGGVYAVGDVNGKLALAHVAFDQGVVAAETIAGHETMPIDDYTNMPRCTYCQPQIASIGLTEAQAREQGINLKVGKVPFQVAGKSVAIGESQGFAKVLIDDDSGAVVGAHIIGPEATELIAEIGMLQMLEGTNLELHKMTHAHPTLSEVVKEAGAAVTGEAIHF
ncbi:MAG: dihydrolipoyl dehydrogenase [Chloroflexi bacterium]|nr:dihydrolipoyl dehydrogenase [Chloroflexota bacterium]